MRYVIDIFQFDCLIRKQPKLAAMRWAAESGILNGYGDGRLTPKGLAACAQVAQMLMNFLGK